MKVINTEFIKTVAKTSGHKDATVQAIFPLMEKIMYYLQVKIQKLPATCIMEKISKRNKMSGQYQVDVCQSFQFQEKRRNFLQYRNFI